MNKIIAFIALCYGCTHVYSQEVDEEMNFLNHVQAFVKEHDNQQPMHFEIEERVEKECALNGHLSTSGVFYFVSRTCNDFLSCFKSCWLMGK